MPPKRRAAPSQTSTAKANLKPKPRASKLARENDISAEQEDEIHEAFKLFAEQHEDYADQKDGVLRMGDVRRCLIALNLLPPRSQLPKLLAALDPEHTGISTYPSFVALCAIQIHASGGSGSGSDLSDGGEEDNDDGDDDYNGGSRRQTASGRGRNSSKAAGKALAPASGSSSRAEIMAAYKLFTHNAPGPITLGHLRRVARELREEVDDGFLVDMINEANGGDGAKKGVGPEEFEGIMRRAGMFT